MVNIAYKNSRGGDPVIMLNHFPTASLRDPRAQAQSWVAAQKNNMSLVELVFILGIGSGFHVIELLTQHPKVDVVAIDWEPLLIANAQSLVRQFAARLTVAQWNSEYQQSQQLRYYLKLPYHVCSFPAVPDMAEMQKQTLGFLTGANREGFDWLKETHQGYLKSLEWENPLVMGYTEDAEVQNQSITSIPNDQLRIRTMLLKELVHFRGQDGCES